MRVLVFGSKGFSITIAILSLDESPESLFLCFSIPFPFGFFLPSFLPSSLPSPRDLPRSPLSLDDFGVTGIGDVGVTGVELDSLP